MRKPLLALVALVVPFGGAAPVHGDALLAVTEIMYNPLKGGDYEFVELENIGDEAIDLAGAAFTVGITYTFPLDDPATVIEPGAFVVVVNDLDSFELIYGDVEVAGEYGGNLANGGEQLRLVDADLAVLVELVYDDERFWPIGPDGFGYSLVPVDPAADIGHGEDWRASAIVDGSPGADDPAPPHGGVVVNEILAHTDPPFEDAIELHNITAGDIDIGGWYLSDERDDRLKLKKYRIPDGTVVPADGYVVFYEYQFNPDPGQQPSFALSSAGDDAYLSSADGAGVLTGYIRGVDFGASSSAVSLGRYETSVGADIATLDARTFGVDDPKSVEAFRTGTGATNSGPRIGPVVLNELQYHPPDEDDEEFIELHNRTGVDIVLFDTDLARGWEVTGITNVEGTDDFEFADGDVIPAGGYLLVVPIFPDDFRVIYGIDESVPIKGPFAGMLSNDGERIRLGRPEPAPEKEKEDVVHVVEDELRYNDGPPWPTEPDGSGRTLERIAAAAYANDPVNWGPSAPPGGTPGARNSVSEPDEPADIDGDGFVGFNDLLLLLAVWGPCEECPADLDGNGFVDFNDLLLLLSVWGPV